MDYTNSAKNRYRYRLEGIDDNWVEAGTNRFANYAQLPDGQLYPADDGLGRWRGLEQARRLSHSGASTRLPHLVGLPALCADAGIGVAGSCTDSSQRGTAAATG